MFLPVVASFPTFLQGTDNDTSVITLTASHQISHVISVVMQNHQFRPDSVNQINAKGSIKIFTSKPFLQSFIFDVRET
jgi:ABC-type arginine/histidine transport system permease subunit